MWREVSFTVARDDVERWSDALLEAGALSVQAEDADAETTDEQALFGEPGMPPPTTLGWRRTRLAALLRADQDARALLVAAGTLLEAEPPLDFATRSFDDQDWVRLSQSQFEPIPIGERLLVTPSWHLDADADSAADVPAGARIPIVLDPGLAFGTGSHPTTRLCLLWLERHLRPGQTVIDYGCGSGILAIAAARLGAGSVIGIDIDPQALVSTRANAAVNRVTIDVRPTSAPAPAAADVVLANILATPLKLLAPLLQSLVRPGGALVLAGLLERQADEVAGYYRDLPMTVFAAEEGWACLAGRKD
jgi:ribosomal protein L11 methyltransferase